MPQRSAITLLALTLLPFTAAAQTKASAWLTTPDGASLVAPQTTKLHFDSKPPAGDVIEIDDTKTFQSIDGFGYALTGGSAQLLMHMTPTARAKILHQLFATKGDAIGVSYLRVSIGSSDMNDRVFTYDDLPSGETDSDLKHFSIDPDRADVIPVLKQILAINPKIKILGSPWSAPSWMKTNGAPKGGELKPEFYPAYAAYFVRYLTAMQQAGIHLDAITIQNEPENPKNTPSMVMSSEQEATFLRDHLGPTLEKAHLNTKVILWDHNCDHPNYPIAILSDSATARYADGSGFHLYLGTIDALTKVHDAFPAKNLYFTEQMVIDARNGTATTSIAKPFSDIVIGATRNWSRNVLLWNLAADPHNNPHTNNGGCPICQGAITIDGDTITRNRAFYTLAHASKFVPPGAVRIASSESDGLPNVAFRTPDHKTVLLIANTGAAAKTFSIRVHQRAVTTSLPAGAIATYVW